MPGTPGSFGSIYQSFIPPQFYSVGRILREYPVSLVACVGVIITFNLSRRIDVLHTVDDIAQVFFHGASLSFGILAPTPGNDDSFGCSANSMRSPQ